MKSVSFHDKSIILEVQYNQICVENADEFQPPNRKRFGTY